MAMVLPVPEGKKEVLLQPKQRDGGSHRKPGELVSERVGFSLSPLWHLHAVETPEGNMEEKLELCVVVTM